MEEFNWQGAQTFQDEPIVGRTPFAELQIDNHILLPHFVSTGVHSAAERWHKPQELTSTHQSVHTDHNTIPFRYPQDANDGMGSFGSSKSPSTTQLWTLTDMATLDALHQPFPTTQSFRQNAGQPMYRPHPPAFASPEMLPSPPQKEWASGSMRQYPNFLSHPSPHPCLPITSTSGPEATNIYFDPYDERILEMVERNAFSLTQTSRVASSFMLPTPPENIHLQQFQMPQGEGAVIGYDEPNIVSQVQDANEQPVEEVEEPAEEDTQPTVEQPPVEVVHQEWRCAHIIHLETDGVAFEDVCGKVYGSEFGLNRHINSDHGPNHYRCPRKGCRKKKGALERTAMGRRDRFIIHLYGKSHKACLRAAVAILGKPIKGKNKASCKEFDETFLVPVGSP